MVLNGKKIRMSDFPTEPKCHGRFNKQLDDKRRLTVPSGWRFAGDNDDHSHLAILTTYGSISVLPPQKISEFYEKISKISMANPAKRRALARFLENSCTFGCDKQGRIMLSEEILDKAGIGKDISLYGMGMSFEIWNPDALDKWLGVASTEDDAELLEELGL